MNKYKIAIGYISGGGLMHYGVTASVYDWMSKGMADRYELTPIFAPPSIYICKNRNHVGAAFLTYTDCDYLLMLDADNGLTAEGLDYFMEDFRDRDVGIVTGKYLYKGDKRGLMVCGYCPPAATKNFHASLPENAFATDVVNVTQAMGRAVVGCGCLMVRRDVLASLPYPWFRVVWDGNETGTTMVGEDLYFSYLAQDHGYDIYLDQRIKSPHYAGKECYPPEWDMTDLDRPDKNVAPELRTITGKEENINGCCNKNNTG